MTSPVVPVVTKPATFLQHLGSILRTMLHIGEEAATIAAPFVAVEFPAIIPLYSGVLGLATGAEGMIGAAPGTGVQKMQMVTPQLIALAQKFATDNKLPWLDADITKWASAVVDTINLIPAPKAN